jgi:hypothetical protein
MTPGQRSAWMGWRGIGLGWVTALCARARGEPSSAHCEQRLSDGSPLARANPCAPAPENRQRRTNQGKADAKLRKCNPVSRFRTYTLCSAALRAVTGWRGGLGRVGADLVSAARMRPPPTPPPPPRTARLAPHTRQSRNGSPVTTKPSPEAPTSPTPALPNDSLKTLAWST